MAPLDYRDDFAAAGDPCWVPCGLHPPRRRVPTDFRWGSDGPLNPVPVVGNSCRLPAATRRRRCSALCPLKTLQGRLEVASVRDALALVDCAAEIAVAPVADTGRFAPNDLVTGRSAPRAPLYDRQSLAVLRHHSAILEEGKEGGEGGAVPPGKEERDSPEGPPSPEQAGSPTPD